MGHPAPALTLLRARRAGSCSVTTCRRASPRARTAPENSGRAALSPAFPCPGRQATDTPPRQDSTPGISEHKGWAHGCVSLTEGGVLTSSFICHHVALKPTRHALKPPCGPTCTPRSYGNASLQTLARGSRPGLSPFSLNDHETRFYSAGCTRRPGGLPLGTGHCSPDAVARGGGDRAGLGHRFRPARAERRLPSRGPGAAEHGPWRAFSSSELAARFSSSMDRRRRPHCGGGPAPRTPGGSGGASAHRLPAATGLPGLTRDPGEQRRRGRRRHGQHQRRRLRARLRRCWRRPGAPAGTRRDELAARPPGVFAVTAAAPRPGLLAPSPTFRAPNSPLRTQLPGRPESPPIPAPEKGSLARPPLPAATAPAAAAAAAYSHRGRLPLTASRRRALELPSPGA